ncbi:85/88 kDa calcium-independent phospholipase A2-like [Brevipalpus obovatus]|uniref:85/88 kDa calcium-independent phospholipase A2-like n=1 Tax=Brevipalpus obovatus TaxID=246614 RepID=UPI003D9E7CF4
MWTRLKRRVDSRKNLSKTSLLECRNDQGSTVSRMELSEVEKMVKVKQDAICYLYHDPQRDLYHIIASKQLESGYIFSLLRMKTIEGAERIFPHYCHIVNSLFNYIGTSCTKIAQTLQETVNCCEANPDYFSSHVAVALGITDAITSKNPRLMASINQRTQSEGITPLMLAIQKDSIPMIKILLSHGASIRSLDSVGNTILHYACRASPPAFQEVANLLERERVIFLAKRENVQGYTAIHWCCLSGSIQNLRSILKMSPPLEVLVAEPYSSKKSAESFHVDSVSLSGEDLLRPNRSDPIPLAKNQSKLTQFSDHSMKFDGIQFPTEVIDDFDETEVIYAGCPLHWCRSRKSLQYLIDVGFPIEARNFRRETPLHTFIRRRRFRSAVYLISHDVDLEARDYRGNTPLHLAVKKNDVSMIQALIGFDADVNSLTARKESPRHMAAVSASKSENRLADVVVNVLHRVGAKRCDDKQKDCTDNCSFDGKGIGTSHPNWLKLEKSAVYLETLARACTIDISASQFNSDLGEKLCSMVSFDGGGVRGLFSCILLLEIERRLKRPFKDYFDWLIGTSSGALIASLVTVGVPLAKIRAMYYSFKDKIFEGPRPYKSEVLEKILKEFLGSQTTFEDVKTKKLLITAVKTDVLPPKLCIFRTYEAEEVIQTEKKRRPSLVLQKNILNEFPEFKFIWRACRASGAAPTFFKPVGSFVDGGLLSNNPSIDGLTEFFMSNNLVSDEKKKNLSFVLSIGTGYLPVQEGITPDMAGLMTPKNNIEMMRTLANLTHIVNVLFQGHLQTEGHVGRRAEAWCQSLGIPYFRINAPLSSDIELNATDDEEIINGMWETKVYAYSIRELIDMVALSLENYWEARNKNVVVENSPGLPARNVARSISDVKREEGSVDRKSG